MDRFWSKVDKSGDCWVWTACLYPKGYGAFKLNGKQIGAHVVSYVMALGPVPEGKEVCHHCDNRKCVRPDHLFAGTRSENMLDAVTKGRVHMPTPKEPGPVPHGTTYGYARKCRCPECKLNYKKVRRERYLRTGN